MHTFIIIFLNRDSYFFLFIFIFIFPFPIYSFCLLRFPLFQALHPFLHHSLSLCLRLPPQSPTTAIKPQLLSLPSSSQRSSPSTPTIFLERTSSKPPLPCRFTSELRRHLCSSIQLRALPQKKKTIVDASHSMTVGANRIEYCFELSLHNGNTGFKARVVQAFCHPHRLKLLGCLHWCKRSRKISPF